MPEVHACFGTQLVCVPSKALEGMRLCLAGQLDEFGNDEHMQETRPFN